MDIDRYGKNSILLYQKVFGECVSAKFPNMVKEMLVNVSLHDMLPYEMNDHYSIAYTQVNQLGYAKAIRN
jgi:hypothetical protein